MLFNEINRRTNFFQIYFLSRNSTYFGQFLCPSSGVLHCVHSALVYVMQFRWNVPVPNVQRRTPDDGQRNCPKYVEFLDKNEFGKISASVSFIKNKFITMHGHIVINLDRNYFQTEWWVIPCYWYPPRVPVLHLFYPFLTCKCFPPFSITFSALQMASVCENTRVGTLIVVTIYLKLIQNRYMFRSFTVLQCSHQHCVQPVASDVEVVGYL